MNISVEVTDPGDRARAEREVAGVVTSWAVEHLDKPWHSVEVAYPHPGGEALVMLRDKRGHLAGNFTVTVTAGSRTS